MFAALPFVVVFRGVWRLYPLPSVLLAAMAVDPAATPTYLRSAGAGCPKPKPAAKTKKTKKAKKATKTRRSSRGSGPR